MSAGVIAANMSWNAANRRNGIVVRVDRARRLADPVEPDVVQPADQAEPARIGAEREAEPDHHPDDADDGQPEEAVHDRRQDVLAPNEPAVEEGQPGEHDHHEGRRGEHPGGVARIDRSAVGGRGGGRERGQQQANRGGRGQRASRRQVHRSILTSGAGLASDIRQPRARTCPRRSYGARTAGSRLAGSPSGRAAVTPARRPVAGRRRRPQPSRHRRRPRAGSRCPGSGPGSGRRPRRAWRAGGPCAA